MASVPVTIVTNTKNVGFPAAINQGLRLARGDYLVLLNNDVIVTDGWLDQLIALVNASRSSVVSAPLSVVEDGEPGVGEGPPVPTMERSHATPPCDGGALTNGEAGAEARAACRTTAFTAYCEAHRAERPHV